MSIRTTIVIIFLSFGFPALSSCVVLVFDREQLQSELAFDSSDSDAPEDNVEEVQTEVVDYAEKH